MVAADFDLAITRAHTEDIFVHGLCMGNINNLFPGSAAGVARKGVAEGGP
jgi:hypothetical protein